MRWDVGGKESDDSTGEAQGATEGATAAEGEARAAPKVGYLPFMFSQDQPSEAEGSKPSFLRASCLQHWHTAMSNTGQRVQVGTSHMIGSSCPAWWIVPLCMMLELQGA